MATIAIQTEEIRPGDVIPNWMDDGRSATVVQVKQMFAHSIMVITDAAPSRRSYKVGRTINVIREA